MTRISVSTVLMILVVGFLCPAAHSAQNIQINNIWKVIQTKGHVQGKTAFDLNTGKPWKTIKPGEVLSAPLYLRTGRDSRVVLLHGKDKVTVASSSLIKFEKEKHTSHGILARIIESIGYAMFSIEHIDGRRNLIETPYLVSVVKGTTFTVQVSKSRTVVNLIRGRLLTEATQFKASTYINSGQSAEVSKGDKTITVLDSNVVVKPAVMSRMHAATPTMPNTTSQNARENPAFDSKGHASPKASAATNGIAGAAESLAPTLPASATGSNGPMAPIHPYIPTHKSNSNASSNGAPATAP